MILNLKLTDIPLLIEFRRKSLRRELYAFNERPYEGMPYGGKPIKNPFQLHEAQIKNFSQWVPVFDEDLERSAKEGEDVGIQLE